VSERNSATDEELMSQAVDGSSPAFEELFARYRKPVTSLCFQFLRDRDKAESASQETFTRLLAHRDKYQKGHKVSTWVLSIAANLCRDQLKRKDRNTLDGLEEMPIQLVDKSDSPEDGAEQAELTAMLMAAIDKLDSIYQEIIVLRVFQDLSYKEISEVAECNESTARSRMELAIKQLRKFFSGKLGKVLEKEKKE
jgi:RNA polymerase sigma-70 factor (ECF subfamily)